MSRELSGKNQLFLGMEYIACKSLTLISSFGLGDVGAVDMTEGVLDVAITDGVLAEFGTIAPLCNLITKSLFS